MVNKDVYNDLIMGGMFNLELRVNSLRRTPDVPEPQTSK